MPERAPVYNLQQAAASGATFIRHELDRLREHARSDDDFDTNRPERIRGGGQSREYYMLAASEWGQKMALLAALANPDE